PPPGAAPDRGPRPGPSRARSTGAPPPSGPAPPPPPEGRRRPGGTANTGRGTPCPRTGPRRAGSRPAPRPRSGRRPAGPPRIVESLPRRASQRCAFGLDLNSGPAAADPGYDEATALEAVA